MRALYSSQFAGASKDAKKNLPGPQAAWTWENCFHDFQMSVLAAPKSANSTSPSLAQAEADLRTEASAIEKLRKQINEAGAKAPKDKMADFAKRQKAYLDRKIELEKRKRGGSGASAGNAPKPVKVADVAKPAEVAKSETKDIEITGETMKATGRSQSPVKKSGISLIVAMLIIATLAMVAWHFFGE